MLASRPARIARLTAALIVLLLMAGAALSHPYHGLETDLEQPDGTVVTVRIWGDEFHQRLETLDGYTVVRESYDGRLCYAERSADALSLVSTGVPAEQAPPARLARRVDLADDIVQAKVAAGREVAGPRGLVSDKVNYSQPAVFGQVRGVALLVDFGDEPATVDPTIVDAMLNQEGYSENNNMGSVRDYFHDVSGEQLELTHTVTPFYYRAAHPKSWYEDPSQSYGVRSRALVEEALANLERRGFDFNEYDANGDGYVDLVSLFYAGGPSYGWGTGLWPQAGLSGFTADGVVARTWHVTPLRDNPTIATACHEIGHALCQWPDLYDRGQESWGVGNYCLMSAPADLGNPVEPCGPLKVLSGWVDTVLLDGVMPGNVATASSNEVYVVYHPWISTELYVIENRHRSGRDASLPDGGLAVWHVDWRGSNDREARLPDVHYMVTLVQADGRWDLENRANQGDDTDMFGGEEFPNFGPDTDPHARWWRIAEADLSLTAISEPAETMTFDFHDGVGIHPVELICEPEALEGQWRITGADGYVKVGRGTRTAYVPTVGSYVISWSEVPGWLAPPGSTVYVTGEEPRPVVEGLYTHPPFSATEVPVLSLVGRGHAGQAVDFDDDGDLDLHLGMLEGPDRLLRNEGGWQFTDVTPPQLAGNQSTLGMQWADVDADGDRDVFVVREDGAVLLRQEAPGQFASPEALSSDLDLVRGAMWIDFDGDRHLDLHLVRDGEADLLLRGPDKSAPRLDEYEVLDILPGHSFARRQGAAWCDYDGNARPDLYSITLYGGNVLLNNAMPAQFENVTHGGLGLPWQSGAAAWGDYDNDGDFDLYYAQDGAADVLFTQYEGIFAMESGLNLGTTGSGKDVVWGDFDNDGDLDLYLARDGQEDRLLINAGNGTWDESPLLIPELKGPSTAVIAADLDQDGGLDLTVIRDGEASVLLHNTMSRGHWLSVVPEGSGSLREPVGAVVHVHAADAVFLRQVTVRSGPSDVARALHFGLGAVTRVDSVTVHWPDGGYQVVHELEVDQSITIRRSASSGGSDDLPAVTAMLVPYPNPFNPGTTLAFDLANASHARLEIFDVRGRRITRLHDGELAAGRHEFPWQGRDSRGRAVAAGVYLVRFQGDQVTQHHRMTLVR